MAFVRHYFAVVDYAYATGDTAPLAAISDTECRPCSQIGKQVNEAAGNGQSYLREATTISNVSEPLDEAITAVEIDVTYSTSGLSLVSDEGVTLASTAPVTNEDLRVLLVGTESGWLMRNYREVQKRE